MAKISPSASCVVPGLAARPAARAAAASACLALAHAARNLRTLRLPRPLAGLTLLALLAVGIMVFSVYRAGRDSLRTEIRSHLTGLAAAAASQVDPRQLALIRMHRDQESADYMALRDQLQRVKALDPAVHEMYIMERTNSPRFYAFLADAAVTADTNGNGVIEPSEQAAAIGERFDISPYPAMRLAFDSPVADRAPSVDKWGAWLSAYAPIRDEDGRAVAMLGVDMSVAELMAREAAFRRAAIIALLALSALILAVSTLLWQRATFCAERERHYRRLQELAHRDYLTDLWNRRYWIEECERELARATRASQHLAVAMVDCDDLKEVNDRLGHCGGDDLLRHVAALIRESIRDVDTAARYGGDEFVILLPESDAEAARALAARLHARMAESQAQCAGEQIASSISIGIAAFPDDGMDVSTLCARADDAMYASKRAQRAGSLS